jgi:uncharacterized protein
MIFSDTWESLFNFPMKFQVWHRNCASINKRPAVRSVHETNSHRSGHKAQDGLVAAMLRPAFYPRPANEIVHKETHISHVFLAGDLVYKIKKPVRYSFLDFSTLAQRRHFLQEELRLNRRLAPSVYLAVMPISCEDDTWRLGGWGDPAEYTLVMRRLPAKRMLDFLLQTEQATAPMMTRLADHLADFHAAADIVQGIRADAYLDALQAQWDDNLVERTPLLSARADHRALEAIDAFGREFLKTHCDLLARRLAEGWIRDVHGDLHAEHVCFAPEGIQIFDCIEFSEKLRRCDLASEMAFLLMDVATRNGAELLGPLIDRYRERMNDADMTTLLPFFQCYRAMVRAKVHALRWGRWNEDTERYLRYAESMTWGAVKPFLLLVCGLSGSGKSTFARAMGERLGMTVVSSDVVRKQLAGNPGRHAAAVLQGIYSPAMSEKTYAAMARRAKDKILKGEGAIIDATFVKRAYRERFAALAARYKIPLIAVHCSASDATTKERLALRASQGIDVSDAGWEVYTAQKAANEPLDDLPSCSLIELRTEGLLEQWIDTGESLLRARLASGRA